MLFGLGKIGAILVPANYRLAGPEIQFIMADAGVKVFIFSPEYAEMTNSFRRDIPAETFLALTGEPPEWGPVV